MVHSAFSAAAVTSSADEPVTDAVTGVIGILALWPGTWDARGIPVGAANATVINVDITQGFYEGECVAEGAETVTSDDIFAASSVRTLAGRIISCTALCSDPYKGCYTDSSEQLDADSTITVSFTPRTDFAPDPRTNLPLGQLEWSCFSTPVSAITASPDLASRPS